MKDRMRGQSLLEILILNGLIAFGVLLTWSLTNQKVTELLDSLLYLIALPFP